MVAAFGSGAMFSLVSGMDGPNLATNGITSGLFLTLVQGGLFKNYEKNFKKGLLTDNLLLPLLTDSALRDVRIPPGPRLLILDRNRRIGPELKPKQKRYRFVPIFSLTRFGRNRTDFISLV
ncbi:mitochondrial import inner membrane translocase Tim17/Tim22/Tim23 family protein [Salix suchowensis]|nr:mitochondrial import inner membrane translocase Tim17/Tim22/Tim23 family protein [Salix suchowensis]